MENILKLLRFAWEYFCDFALTIRYNCYSPFEDKNLRFYYRLLIITHAIEKGLSLANPRLLFGQAKIRYIISMAREYDSSLSEFPLEMAAGALSDYLEVHRKAGVTDGFLDELEHWLEPSGLLGEYAKAGGYKRLEELKHVSEERRGECLEFMKSRYSCRHYQQRAVPANVVEDIVRAAQTAPSQCNRQSVRIHCYQDKQKIIELLQLQGGASGFAEGVNNLFVVTSEITAWGGYGQRNQGFVDGGLLGQSLFLACHAYGVGSCGLNLAVDNAKEKRIKTTAGIHPRERLIMMVSFGYPGQEDLKAARSPRIPLDSVLKIHR
jgi:nitroreductase